MKKAYVKPVFVAEEFLAETSYASVICDPSMRSELLVKDGDIWCDTHGANNTGNCSFIVNENGTGHGSSKLGLGSMYTGTINGQTNTDKYFSFMDYAKQPENDNAYLFTDANTACDFLWDGDTESDVRAYGDTEKTNTAWIFLGKLSSFFFGNSSDNSNAHHIGYMGSKMQSI